MDKKERDASLKNIERKLNLLQIRLNTPENVSGVGPVRNADIYASMMEKSPWLGIRSYMEEDIQPYGMTPKTGTLGVNEETSTEPVIKTPAGYISVNDANKITTYGIPAEYTETFTQKPWVDYDFILPGLNKVQYAKQKNASENAVAGPVSDGEEYADLKERADKTAKKKFNI
jgi:hypothetical protein